jgi:hypothetical protein
MNSKLTPRERLAAFDDEHGEVVINALAVYAEHMRETADEALKGARRPEQRNPADLRDWGQEDLLVLARAAGMLWDSTSRQDPLDVLSGHQIELLKLASHAYLPAPEQAAENATSTISLRPTPGGFAGMAAAFTDAADRADAAARAYEHLTGRDEPEDYDIDTASTEQWFAESRRHGCTGTGYSTADDTIEHRDPGPCPVHPGL